MLKDLHQHIIEVNEKEDTTDGKLGFKLIGDWLGVVFSKSDKSKILKHCEAQSASVIDLYISLLLLEPEYTLEVTQFGYGVKEITILILKDIISKQTA